MGFDTDKFVRDGVASTMKFELGLLQGLKGIKDMFKKKKKKSKAIVDNNGNRINF